MKVLVSLTAVAFVGLIAIAATKDFVETRERVVVEKGKNYIVYEVNKPASQIWEFRDVLKRRPDDQRYKVSKKYLVIIEKISGCNIVPDYIERYRENDVVTWSRVGGRYYTCSMNVLTDNYEKIKIFFGKDLR